MNRSHDVYRQRLESARGEHEPLPQDLRKELLQRWREVYAAGLHAATGKWKRGEYEWHVFSYRDARALPGEAAVQAYRNECGSPLIVCPEEYRLAAYRLSGGQPPEFQGSLLDIYVWPEDLTWTMAFTHEEGIGLGPYFSRAEWIVDRPRSRPR